MSVAIWPLTIPQKPQRSGYGWKEPNELLRSEMDSGPAKVRPRGKAKPVPETQVYIMTTEQLAMFRAFVRDTLATGALCFDWPHPVLGRYVRARLVGQSDAIYSVSPWNKTNAWQVSLTMEIWPDAPIA